MAMRPSLLLGILALSLPACGGDGTSQQQQGLCTDDERASQYVAGLEQASDAGMFKAKLLAGTPAPPDRGNNTWTISVLDPSGAPMSGVNEVRVKAWMPDHGHGTNPLWNDATVQPDGTYQVGPFNLFMPGLWQFTVSVEAANQNDTAVVSFCVEG
jgi:hypothetical protein